jgi:hypothetical protein
MKGLPIIARSFCSFSDGMKATGFLKWTRQKESHVLALLGRGFGYAGPDNDADLDSFAWNRRSGLRRKNL